MQEEPIMSASLHKYANGNRRLQTQALVTKRMKERTIGVTESAILSDLTPLSKVLIKS